jgi:hypothetical protein
MQGLLMLQQVVHLTATGHLNGFKLGQDGTNAYMCWEIILKDSDTSWAG